MHLIQSTMTLPAHRNWIHLILLNQMRVPIIRPSRTLMTPTKIRTIHRTHISSAFLCHASAYLLVGEGKMKSRTNIRLGILLLSRISRVVRRPLRFINIQPLRLNLLLRLLSPERREIFISNNMLRILNTDRHQPPRLGHLYPVPSSILSPTEHFNSDNLSISIQQLCPSIRATLLHKKFTPAAPAPSLRHSNTHHRPTTPL